MGTVQPTLCGSSPRDLAWLDTPLFKATLDTSTLELQKVAERERYRASGMSERFKPMVENIVWNTGELHYEVVRQFAADGQPIGGLRRIKRDEATVIRRAFKLFAGGKSPKAIATHFNNEKIPAPAGGLWAETTIRGHAKRHCGILRNDIYRGKLIWNRQRFVKDPVSGKRIPRANPESQWVVQDVPELRMITEELWEKVQERFGDVRRMPLGDEIRV